MAELVALVARLPGTDDDRAAVLARAAGILERPAADNC